MATKSNETNRLAKWSERKLAQAPSEAAETAALVEPAETAALVEPAGSVPDEARAEPPEDLPDIDSLDAESDFAVFMREGVPEDLKNLALRKLWRSDPVYANLDGLNDYDPEHVSFLVQATEVAKDMLDKALKDDGRTDAAPVSEQDAPGDDAARSAEADLSDAEPQAIENASSVDASFEADEGAEAVPVDAERGCSG